MKKILVLLALAANFGANAQTEKGLFFDANMGTRFGGTTSELATLRPGFHADAGMGYMFNNFIGIKGQIGFNRFTAVSAADEGIKDFSSMFNANLECVFGLSQVIGFGTERFDLYLHSGVGMNAFSNKGYKESYLENKEFEDRLFKGSDEAFNVSFGLTPTFHVNEKISLRLDVAHFVIFGQSNTVDRQIGNSPLDKVTGVSTTTIGLSYRL
jgi:hypothetical protein